MTADAGPQAEEGADGGWVRRSARGAQPKYEGGVALSSPTSQMNRETGTIEPRELPVLAARSRR